LSNGRRRKRKGASDADTSEGRPGYGRDRGKTGLGLTESKLETQGPAPRESAIQGPLGYSFRNIEAFADNADRLQILQFTKGFDLRGRIHANANGSTLPTDSTLSWLESIFFESIYPQKHILAQRRDGYRATAATINDNTYPVLRDNVIVRAKTNIRVVNALATACLVNEGMRTMLTGFADTYDEIKRLLQYSNELMYSEKLDEIINWHSQIYTPYTGGPLVFALMDFEEIGELAPSAGAFTAWADQPDFNVAADVAAVLSDIKVALDMILQRDMAANPASDELNLLSIYSMLGMHTPQTPAPLLKVDPERWIWDFEMGACHMVDDKGAGVDTHVYWPDMNGSAQTLINLNLPIVPSPDDWLFWIGAKCPYAFEADDDANPGYTAASADFTALGMVVRQSQEVNQYLRPDFKVYTREDGWANLSGNLDFTDVSGVQAYIWSRPWLSQHPDAWRFIMSEEAEEIYHINLKTPGVQVPVDVFAQAAKMWLYDTYGIPFLT